jgi:hypothetical protein
MQRPVGVIVTGLVVLSALAGAEPTPGLPATLRVLVAADEILMLKYLSEDALALIALARRE